MKAFARIFILVLSICFSIFASPFNDGVSKKDLLDENLRLRISLDSLRHIVDSLQREAAIHDSIVSVAFRQEELPPAIPEKNYTAEEADSLMNVWYSTLKNYSADDYTIISDSIRFSSNVSDEEMMRRLSAMNAFVTLPFNPTVKNYMVLYAEKMPAAMNRMLGLSEYYFPIIEEALVRYDLPVELKYMTIVESKLNPVATSRVGAKGMWQFMYSTAKIYGLKINSFVDERLDVEKAVDAACRYLRDAYRVFGDWNLAISSYNCGAGNVQKAIRRAGSTKFWDIYDYLPRETRGYVPAFVGAMYAFNYAKEYGLSPADVGMPAATDTFHICRNLHFQQINEVIGVPMETIKNLNPQYTHDIIPGDEGTFILKLPYQWTAAFVDAERDSLYLHKSGQLLNPQVIKNIKESGSEVRVAYKVKSGDYLGKIAGRYHVSVNQLMKWNHLRSTNLRVGQTLYIYTRGAGPADVKSSSAPDAAKTSSSSSKKYSGYVTYTVKSGDTFYAISQNYPGISAKDIMDFNGVSSTALRPGMKIKIPKL